MFSLFKKSGTKGHAGHRAAHAHGGGCCGGGGHGHDHADTDEAQQRERTVASGADAETPDETPSTEVRSHAHT